MTEEAPGNRLLSVNRFCIVNVGPYSSLFLSVTRAPIIKVSIPVHSVVVAGFVRCVSSGNASECCNDKAARSLSDKI